MHCFSHWAGSASTDFPTAGVAGGVLAAVVAVCLVLVAVVIVILAVRKHYSDPHNVPTIASPTRFVFCV